VELSSLGVVGRGAPSHVLSIVPKIVQCVRASRAAHCPCIFHRVFLLGVVFLFWFFATNGAKGLCQRAPKVWAKPSRLAAANTRFIRGRSGDCVGATPGLVLATVVGCGRSNTVVLCVFCGDLCW